MGIARCKLERDRPTVIVGQRVDLGRTAAARAPDGIAEGPPFAPAAERCALMWTSRDEPRVGLRSRACGC
jgi:hypothetical protein